MNRTFKVVGRFKSEEEQQSWRRGKPGRIAKKRVYTSLDAINKYGPELITRYREIYDVELFELIEGEWMAV